jgi:hypothetical protein
MHTHTQTGACAPEAKPTNPPANAPRITTPAEAGSLAESCQPMRTRFCWNTTPHGPVWYGIVDAPAGAADKRPGEVHWFA